MTERTVMVYPRQDESIVVECPHPRSRINRTGTLEQSHRGDARLGGDVGRRWAPDPRGGHPVDTRTGDLTSSNTRPSHLRDVASFHGDAVFVDGVRPGHVVLAAATSAGRYALLVKGQRRLSPDAATRTTAMTPELSLEWRPTTAVAGSTAEQPF